jgi:hypothetical protein
MLLDYDKLGFLGFKMGESLLISEKINDMNGGKKYISIRISKFISMK